MNSVIGGVIGLFVGFILAAMGMSLLFFRRAPGQRPGLAFFVQPLLFLGFIIAGSAVGAAIASRMPIAPTAGAWWCLRQPEND